MADAYLWRLEEAAKRAKHPLQGANREHNWAKGQLRRARLFAVAQMSDVVSANALEKLFQEEEEHREYVFGQLKERIEKWKAEQ